MTSAVFSWWPTRGRQMAFPLCLFAVFVSLVTHVVPVASAHSYLVRAEPSAGQLLVEAPRVLQLWFSEEPEPRFSQVQLLTTGGIVVQTVPMSVAPEDPRLAVIRLAPLPGGGRETGHQRGQHGGGADHHRAVASHVLPHAVAGRLRRRRDGPPVEIGRAHV